MFADQPTLGPSSVDDVELAIYDALDELEEPAWLSTSLLAGKLPRTAAKVAAGGVLTSPVDVPNTVSIRPFLDTNARASSASLALADPPPVAAKTPPPPRRDRTVEPPATASSATQATDSSPPADEDGDPTPTKGALLSLGTVTHQSILAQVRESRSSMKMSKW